jgi:preprotein translocase subunit SecB
VTAGVEDKGGVEVIALRTAMMTPLAIATRPPALFGFARTVFQSTAARTPSAEVNPAAINVR